MLVTISRDGSVSVEDTDGGVWHPSDEALEEIDASDDPEATAIQICEQDPTRGEWVQ